jgi:membrane protease YdiL (CAAX protease family)
MSFPPNPLPPEETPLPSELDPAPLSEAGSEIALSRNDGENPPWTLWDLLLLVVVAGGLLVIFLPVAAFLFFGTTHIFGYSLQGLASNRSELDRFVYDPRVGLPIQLLGYVVLLVLMVGIVRARTGVDRGFFQSLSWRWPRGTWPGFLLAGAILQVLIQVISTRLPIPHSLPIEKFFQTPTYAYLMGGFSILVAPFMEELFFRGFLYPSLARVAGMATSVSLTSLVFMLVHGAQLSFSWAALLPIFIVGLVLTLVRARTRSLAASMLMHVSYNATLFLIIFIGTGGFRHMERL